MERMIHMPTMGSRLVTAGMAPFTRATRSQRV